jgi:hypothetical protein
MKKIVLFAMLFAVVTAAVAQEEEKKAKIETTIKADFVNQYIWRALDMGSVAVQPTLGVGYKGLSLTAWGSYGITNKDDVKEFDLTLAYTNGKFNVGIIDYWNDENGNRYFNYKKGETWHTFEGFVCYDFGPVSASWQTFFAGNDYQEDDGKRAYSSYFELSAPFRLATCDWDATVGLIPWKSYYYETSGFSLTNLSLRATKDIQITNSFSLPLFGQLIANPASQHFYFVFGFTLKAL